jgi:hypothetical protein
MTLRHMLALSGVVLLTAQTPSPALVGAVYQYRGGNSSTSTALAGALVYVHTAASTDGDWIGPIVTDAYGRFTFAQLYRGRYVLRVFRGSKSVWQQEVTVPGKLPPIIVPT